MRLVNAAHRVGIALTVKDIFSEPVLSDMVAMMRRVSSDAVSSKKEGPSLKPQISPLFSLSSSSSSSASISSSLITCLTQLGFSTDNIESIAAATELQADSAALTELDGETNSSTLNLESIAGLDISQITRAYKAVIRHHPLLRTVFVQCGTTLQQVVLKAPPRGMVLLTREGEDDEGHLEINTVLGDSLPQFRLQAKGKECYKLSLKIRHALYDAISLTIVFQDLRNAYIQQALLRGPSFHDWLSYINSLNTAASRKFWTQALHGLSMTYVVRLIRLPTSGSFCRDDITIRVPLIVTSYGTSSSVLQAV